jgi:WhiB family redox-sensing transcriptional regulator
MTLELAPGDTEVRASAWHSFYFELLSDQDPPTTLEDFVGPRPAWMADAACHDSGVNFFPERGESLDPARAICGRCPVAPDCLAYALAHVELRGVWAGTGERQRMRLRRARA